MVNYCRSAVLEAAPRIYRLRLLNGSGARIMRLAFMLEERAYPFKVIGADGGLLERALSADESFLAPGERLDVLLDLRGLAPDTTLTLRSLGFDAMNAGLAQLCVSAPAPAPMPGHAAHVSSRKQPGPAAQGEQAPLADGAPFDLLSIRLIAGPVYRREVPSVLAKMPEIDSRTAKRRTFDLDHQKMQWRINGVRFDMLGTQLSVERGSIEVWEFRNPPGGMAHPVHFHGFPFRALERKGSPEAVRRIAIDQHGLSAAETGWKDTVLVWPGERVRVALDFSHDYPGEQVYMLHCHNLEHEDQGMMLNVRIVPPGSRRA
jgi:suppressor of ftsI/bilirubin oxidase